MVGNISVHLLTLDEGFDRGKMEGILNIFPKDRIVSIISPRAVYDWFHLIAAYVHAGRNISSGRSRTRDPALEVLRSLSGSRQLGEGLKIASPSRGEKRIIVSLAPKDWPRMYDPRDPPGIDHPFIGETPQGMGSVGLEDIDPQLGGLEALRILGIPAAGDPEENRMRVLEKVALTDL